MGDGGNAGTGRKMGGRKREGRGDVSWLIEVRV